MRHAAPLIRLTRHLAPSTQPRRVEEFRSSHPCSMPCITALLQAGCYEVNQRTNRLRRHNGRASVSWSQEVTCLMFQNKR